MLPSASGSYAVGRVVVSRRVVLVESAPGVAVRWPVALVFAADRLVGSYCESIMAATLAQDKPSTPLKRSYPDPMVSMPPNTRRQVEKIGAWTGARYWDRTTLPSMASYDKVRNGVGSLFVDYGPAESESFVGGDRWWLSRIHEIHCGEWSLELWQSEVEGSEDVVSYDSSHVFHGSDDYSTYSCYGVKPEVMYALLSGSCADFGWFVRAEGQLCRVMLSTPEHEIRLVAYRAWLVLIGRFCGGLAYAKGSRLVSKLAELSPSTLVCNASGFNGMFYGFLKHANNMIRIQSIWYYVLGIVDKLRDDYFGDWSFDCYICPLHGWECLSFLSAIELDWEATRENTPDTEASDDDAGDDGSVCGTI